MLLVVCKKPKMTSLTTALKSFVYSKCPRTRVLTGNSIYQCISVSAHIKIFGESHLRSDQLSPETSFTKPKPTKPVFRPIRIQNLRFNPIRAFVLFLINGSGDPLSLIKTLTLKSHEKIFSGYLEKFFHQLLKKTYNQSLLKSSKK